MPSGVPPADGWWSLARRDRWLWAFTVLGLGLRLIWIDQPLVDQQAWRQADTAAIARNYYEEGYDLLYPRIDWRGDSSGFVESEFPLYPFTVAVFYQVLGDAHEWVGRLLSALASAAAGVLLYGLAVRLYGPGWPPRLAALVFLLSPFNVYFGRAFMPEATMLLFSVGALLAFACWAESGERALLAAAVVATTLAFLVKIPTLYLGFPLVALAWARWGWGFLRRPVLWLFLVLVLLPPALWYYHAHRLFEQTGLTFGIWNSYGYDKWSGSGADLAYWLLMVRRLGEGVLTPVGLALVLLGLTWQRGGRGEIMVYAWVGGLLLYLTLVPEGNRRLEYYQLPFVAPGALLAGKALAEFLGPSPGTASWLSRTAARVAPRLRTAMTLGLLAAMVAWGAVVAEPLYRPPNLRGYYTGCRYAGEILARKLPSGVLLVVGDLDENAGAPRRAQSPTMLYYCRRKGWQITPQEFSQARLDSLAEQGAAYFVVPGGFAYARQGFWLGLFDRGVTIPSAYPEFFTEPAALEQVRRRRGEPDRDFLVVRLQPEPGRAGAR